MTIPITVAYGDGSGPEVMEATLTILREAGAPLVIDSIEIGQRIYNMGSTSGILPSSFEALRASHVLLKGPTASLDTGENVTGAICKHFELDETHHSVRDCDDISAACYIGENFALFEPVMGTEVPRKNTANPSSMILASILMLEHIGAHGTARIIQNAWQRTLAEGIHTSDRYVRGESRKKVSTGEFIEAMIERLHQAALAS